MASFVYNLVPIAIPDLVQLDITPNIIIQLKGYDLDGNKLQFVVTRLPIYGNLYQLSQVYSNYGYKPIAGIPINLNNIIDTIAKQRIYYSLSYMQSGCAKQYVESFSFIVDNGSRRSYETNITIVNREGIIICSDFLLGIDGWNIVGNKPSFENPIFEPYSRGLHMNHYIYASDNKINIDKNGDTDKSLWFFNAPSKFLGNMGIAYGGFIQFSISIFAGDVTKLNYGKKYNLIELECARCGVTIVYPYSKYKFKNDIALFQIPLLETKGWLKDPHNSLLSWNPPTKCDFLQVLSNLSAFRILGDVTTWYETIALDNVFIINTRKYIPRCAFARPDASICTC